MKKVFFSLLLLASFVFGDDYGFSLDELESIETKEYESSGYVRGDYKYQNLMSELFFNYKYFKDKFTFETDLMANFEQVESASEKTASINQAFVNYKYDDNHQLNIGKITPKWGKGYYFNPVAFIDRKKDPNEPQLSREGFSSLNYQYNKVYNDKLQNLAFDIFYIRTTKDINHYLYNNNSNIAAMKLYLLYNDIDIDIIYSYSDKDANKIGVNFSTNIETNFEIHGEYAKFDNGYYSYLLGVKYLTEDELTILSEYFYQSITQSKTTPFWDNQYLINSFTQKEPFDTLYLSIYFKNILNMNDSSYQNKIGFIYSGIENFEMDISFSQNRGKNGSEFESKKIKQFGWISLKYSF
jgi:hypothetical protein